MNNRLDPTSATNPVPGSQSNDERFWITFWCGKYEGHLFLNSPNATYERYSRAISKFISHFPEKQFTYDFLRPDIETYKEARLKQGASATTVNIELSILRGFWRFMLWMEAPGVMINPARGVRVKMPSKKRKTGRPAEDQQQPQSPA